MSYNKVIVAFVLVSFAAVGCGSTDKKEASGTGGASGAPAGTGGAAPAGTGGAAPAGTGGAAPVATGTGAAPAAAPVVTMCGSTMCPAAGVLGLVRPTCCTADKKCGIANAMTPTICELPYVNTSKCPDTMVLGQMAPGCCMDDGTTCGIFDVTGFIGGCNSRCSAAAFSPGILPASCSDGVPMGMCPAPAGTGGMGTGGMAAAGGTGGT